MQKYFLLVGLIFINSATLAYSNDNIPTTVVTCTSNKCPPLPTLSSNDDFKEAVIFETSNHHRAQFMQKYTQPFVSSSNGGWQSIEIDESKYVDTQPIIGFGGAFTDTVGMLYNGMTSELQKEFIDAYFSTNGSEYSLGRVPISSTDFSCRKLVRENNRNVAKPTLADCSVVFSQYSYVDESYFSLNGFALQQEDLQYKIPMIQAALKVRALSDQNNPLKLFASAWSAPSWMKTNGSMIHGNLALNYHQMYADYFVRFLQEYKKQGVTFWGLTVQNEPVKPALISRYLNWQTMYFTQEQEAYFIKDYLGPTLDKFSKDYGSKINIMMHDDQILSIHKRATIVNDPKVAKYVNGAALHWYVNNRMFNHHLDKAYQTLNSTPDKGKRFILGTEACEGYFPTNKGPKLGSWSRGEAYAHDIIKDLNHHVSGWTDWNLVLDMHGGPTWAGNYVDAPILADLEKQTLYKQPMYYYLAHFSKFLKPGAKLLATQSKGPLALEEVTYHTPAHDGIPETIVVVVLNRGHLGKKYFIRDLSVKSERKYLNMYIPPHGIQTIVFQKGL